MPKRPTTLVAASLVLGLLALALSFAGVGSSSPAPHLGRGALTVAGVDPRAGVVRVNLDQSIPIVVRNIPANLGSSPTARLVLYLDGLAVVHSTATSLSRNHGTLSGSVDASIGRYVVGGKLAATLELNGSRTVTDSFAIQATRAPITTFAGVVGIVLLLVVVAYTESLLRTLRLGRRRDKRGALLGLVVIGAIGGASASLWGWILGLDRPAFVGLVITAVIGAAAGLLAGLAGRRAGERARVHRRSNRLVLVAKRTAPLPSDPTPVGVG